MTSSTPLMENKKKKERRKEKDTSAVETSDEEANSSQGKNLCVIVKLVGPLTFRKKEKVRLPISSINYLW